VYCIKKSGEQADSSESCTSPLSLYVLFANRVAIESYRPTLKSLLEMMGFPLYDSLYVFLIDSPYLLISDDNNGSRCMEKESCIPHPLYMPSLPSMSISSDD